MMITILRIQRKFQTIKTENNLLVLRGYDHYLHTRVKQTGISSLKRIQHQHDCPNLKQNLIPKLHN